MKQIKIIITEKDIDATVWVINKPDSMMKASARVKIGPISISDFRVLESKDKTGSGLWVDAPVKKVGEKKEFTKTTWIDNADLWKNIQELVIEKYKGAIEKKVSFL
jgi:DNA-binding cell septation regulator SpoVG